MGLEFNRRDIRTVIVVFQDGTSMMVQNPQSAFVRQHVIHESTDDKLPSRRETEIRIVER